MTGKELRIIIARNMKQQRLNKQMTQEELGQKIGIHQVSVNRIERNNRGISLETLAKFAEAFDIQPRDLL